MMQKDENLLNNLEEIANYRGVCAKTMLKFIKDNPTFPAKKTHNRWRSDKRLIGEWELKYLSEKI